MIADWRSRAPVGVILALHITLLAWSACRHSPTFNEIGHLPAGISHLRYGMFDLYRVNPPLPRIVAALPLLLCEHETDWSGYDPTSSGRGEIPVGVEFTSANGGRTFWLYTVARWACIPFCVLGAVVCYLWSRRLFGPVGGLLSLSAWCFSPFVLGNGPLVMPDVPAAAVGIAACYAFRGWLKQPSVATSATCGVLLGLAQLCKSTLLVLYGVWGVLWLAAVLLRGRRARWEWLHAAAIVVVSVHVINCGYLFRGSFTPLSGYGFQSRLLGGAAVANDPSANRFRNTFLGRIHVPLPRDYVLGVDRQRADFEEGDWSYLRGEWRHGGWWYYHLYALLVKLPIGLWLMIAVALGLVIAKHGFRQSLLDELCVALPGLAIVALVSSQYGFSNHSRYVIPALPFLFVWIGRLWPLFSSSRRGMQVLVAASFVWSMAGSLTTFPHSLSYFNEAVGGPRSGHRHLLDSNIAWGQDVLFLRDWCAAHPNSQPTYLAAFGWTDPRLAGIQFQLPPPCPPCDDPSKTCLAALPPGTYIIDVNHLQGTNWDAPDGAGGWQFTRGSERKFTCFQQLRPDDRVAYSYYVFQIPEKTAAHPPD